MTGAFIFVQHLKSKLNSCGVKYTSISCSHCFELLLSVEWNQLCFVHGHDQYVFLYKNPMLKNLYSINIMRDGCFAVGIGHISCSIFDN